MKYFSTSLQEVSAVLTLPPAPNNYSTHDWYWRKICGVPLLLRNIFSLQKSGLNSILIYSKKINNHLYKRVFENKKIFIKIAWTEDTKVVTKLTNGYPVIFLSGSALYNEKEIQTGVSSLRTNYQNTNHPIKEEAIAGILNKINLRNYLDQNLSLGSLNSGLFFLQTDKNSWINKPRDFHIQHENLLKTSGLSNDSFLDKNITRFFSRQITRLFLQTNLSPNIITLFSLILGLIAAIYFGQGIYKNNLIGVGFLLLSTWVDCTDGEIARLKFMESKIGGKLDIICDNLVHIAVFFFIGIGLYQSTNKSIFLTFGTLAVVGTLICFIILSSSIIHEKENSSREKLNFSVKNDLISKLANRDFIYLLFIMSVIDRLDIFIFITALGSIAFSVYLTYSRFKSPTNTN